MFATNDTLPTTSKDLDAVIDQQMEALVAELAAGRHERLEAYLAFAGKFHKYSFGNQMLIQMQCPAATWVAGYKTWQGMGQQVAKGQKAIKILAPHSYVKQPEKEGDKAKHGIYFVAVPVFDASQLAPNPDKPLPFFFQPLGNDGQALYERLVAAATKDGRRVEERAETGTAEGFNSDKLIVIKAGLDGTNKFLTGIHEWAHSLLHWGPDRASLTRQQKEAQAEATAFIVAAHFGIHNPFSADYVKSWGQTPATLRAELEACRKAASHIIMALEGKSEEEPAA